MGLPAPFPFPTTEFPTLCCDLERAAVSIIGLTDEGLIHVRLRAVPLSPHQIAQHLADIINRAKSIASAA